MINKDIIYIFKLWLRDWDPGQRLQMLQYPTGNWDKGCCEFKKQGRPDGAVPLDEGEQGQMCNQKLQQFILFVNSRYSKDWNGGGYFKPWLKNSLIL